MVLRDPRTEPFDRIEHIAVSVREVQFRGRSGRHTGFIYRLDKAPPRLVHLRWHYNLSDELPSVDEDLWQELGLDEPNRVFLAGWVSQLGQNQDAIPYGFDSGGNCFEVGTGAYIAPPPGKGLTCATFVSGVLNNLGYDLVDEASWPVRISDLGWQTLIIHALQDTGASQAHIDAIDADLGNIRLRPEEVAAAATVDGTLWPTTFQIVEPLSREVLAELTAARARPV